MSFKEIMSGNQFCILNNAEVAPEICNEFITIYMEGRKENSGI